MESSLWDYLAVVIKWRRVIVANFLIVAVIVAVISLFLPPWYEARTTILPPEKETGSLGLSAGLLGGLGAALLGGGGMALPAPRILSTRYMGAVAGSTLLKSSWRTSPVWLFTP